MTETAEVTVPAEPVAQTEQAQPVDTAGAAKTAKIVYWLYLSSIILGITGLIGVIMAYVNKNDSPGYVADHYRYAIRTFWIGLLYAFIGGLTMVIVIGWFILLFWLVWLIVRCVKGLKALDKQESPANLTGWFF